MRKLLKAAAVVSSSIFASRVLGLVRDVIIASTFGAGALTDVFFVAFRVPNLLRRIFAEGAFNSAFVPAFSKKLKSSFQEAVRFAGEFFTVLTVLLTITVLLLELSAPYLVKLLAPGFSGESFTLAVRLLRELLPYIFLVSLVAFFGGILNSLNHFFAPAFSTALFNLAIIVSALALSSSLSIESLSVGVIVGGILQLLLQLLFLKKLSFPIRPILSVSRDVVEVLKNTIPGIFGFAVRQISMLIDTVIASFLQHGTISYLYYANRFVQLPLGMFAIGLSQVLLPRLSKKGERRDLKEELLDGITLCTAIVIPSAVGLIFFGKPIVDAVFGHGKFTQEALLSTYLVLVGYSVGLLFFSLEKIVTNAFYSMEEFKLPVAVSASTLVFNLLIDIFFCFFLGLGAFGLALGTSFTSLLNLLLLVFFLTKRIGSGLFGKLLVNSVRYFLYSVPIAIISTFGERLYFSADSFGGKVAVLLGVIALSAALYALLLAAVKDEVFKAIIGKEAS